MKKYPVSPKLVPYSNSRFNATYLVLCTWMNKYCLSLRPEVWPLWAPDPAHMDLASSWITALLFLSISFFPHPRPSNLTSPPPSPASSSVPLFKMPFKCHLLVKSSCILMDRKPLPHVCSYSIVVTPCGYLPTEVSASGIVSAACCHLPPWVPSTQNRGLMDTQGCLPSPLLSCLIHPFSLHLPPFLPLLTPLKTGFKTSKEKMHASIWELVPAPCHTSQPPFIALEAALSSRWGLSLLWGEGRLCQWGVPSALPYKGRSPYHLLSLFGVPNVAVAISRFLFHHQFPHLYGIIPITI